MEPDRDRLTPAPGWYAASRAGQAQSEQEAPVTNTARMPGRVRPSWCPHCRTTPGPDCPDTSRTPKQVRRTEQRTTDSEITEGLHEWADEQETP